MKAALANSSPDVGVFNRYRKWSQRQALLEYLRAIDVATQAFELVTFLAIPSPSPKSLAVAVFTNLKFDFLIGVPSPIPS